jgi:hypothetical protein
LGLADGGEDFEEVADAGFDALALGEFARELAGADGGALRGEEGADGGDLIGGRFKAALASFASASTCAEQQKLF